jgi:hypothetical protein
MKTKGRREGLSSKVLVPDGADHGLVNYIDNKAKCRHLKKLTCKGTLQQV